jgi:hypothetical protein
MNDQWNEWAEEFEALDCSAIIDQEEEELTYEDIMEMLE